MTSHRKIILGVFIAAASSVHAAEDWVEIRAQKGESLMEFVHRTHSCPFTSDDNSLQRVIKLNPETVGPEGKFVLSQNVVKVPKSFMDSADSCHESAGTAAVEPKSQAHETEAHAENVHEGITEHETENEFKFGTFLEYTKISANGYNGESADVTSKPEYGFGVEYDRKLSRSFFLGARFVYTHATFQELEVRELKEEATTFKTGSLRAGFQLEHHTTFTFDVGAAQVDHVIPEIETVTIEHVWVPKLAFELRHTFFEATGFEFGGGLGGTLFLPARGIAKTSLAENAILYVERELSSIFTIELGFGAQYIRQTFQDEAHSQTSYGSDLALGVHF